MFPGSTPWIKDLISKRDPLDLHFEKLTVAAGWRRDRRGQGGSRQTVSSCCRWPQGVVAAGLASDGGGGGFWTDSGGAERKKKRTVISVKSAIS